MVGVPSSRGCDGCRKQKKKCHVENALPPCERCRKLNIQCIGYGSQRLKFQDESKKFAPVAQPPRKSQTGSNGRRPVVVLNQLVQFPSSPRGGRLTSEFARSIDCTVDISVQLPWNFGFFLDQVPRRLGSNAALDGAADALVSVYRKIRAPDAPGVDRLCLQKYCKAIAALRTCLGDSEAAVQVETLCAINMLIIFETLSGNDYARVLQHAGGASRIFKMRGLGSFRNEFETQLMLSLRGSVIIHSLFLDTDYFTEAEWPHLTESQMGSDTEEEQAFRCFGNYARLFQQGRKIEEATRTGLAPPSAVTDSPTIWQLIHEVFSLRDRISPRIDVIKSYLSTLNERLESTYQTVSTAKKNNKGHEYSTDCPAAKKLCSLWPLKTLHCHVARSLAFAMTTKILINVLFAALSRISDSETAPIDSLNAPTIKSSFLQLLEEENIELGAEIVAIVEQVSFHRPLGTVFVPFVLRIAHMAFPPDEDVSRSYSFSANLGEERPSTPPHDNMRGRIRLLLRSHALDFEQVLGDMSADESLRLGSAADRKTAADLDWLGEYFSLRTPLSEEARLMP